ncbi:MAG: hypothetical protein ACQEQE_00150 [Bacillota bacterium]
MFKKILLIILIIVLSLNIVLANNSQESDPLVTLSYLEKRINELREYIDYNKKQTSSKYKVVEIKKGSKVYFEQESLEFILRSGKASAIASQNGDGLSDLTAGKDLKTGDLIQKNHLMLIPRNDSRGLKALTNIWIMIKGKYRVENE